MMCTRTICDCHCTVRSIQPLRLSYGPLLSLIGKHRLCLCTVSNCRRHQLSTGSVRAADVTGAALVTFHVSPVRSTDSSSHASAKHTTHPRPQPPNISRANPDIPPTQPTHPPPLVLPHRMTSSAHDRLDKPFASPFRGDDDSFRAASVPRSLQQLAMSRMSAAIRSKPSWRTKRHNKDIADKWRHEAANIDPLLSPAAIQYALDELDYYDALLDAETGTEMSAVDGVWQSDSLLPSELIADIRQAVQQCWGGESTERRDWHPGSGGQVWDMVHPSLYCLVAGRTRVVAEDIGLERAIGMMCSGRLLGEREYGRLVTQRMAALRVVDNRWRSIESTEADSDDEAAAARQATERQAEQQPERSREDVAAEAKAAWEEGKIVLQVYAPEPHTGSRRRMAVYVQPDARLADVRAQVASRLPTSWRGWSLKKGDQAITAAEEAQPLYAIGIHCDNMLEAVQDEVPEDKVAVAEAERAQAAREAVKPIGVTVTTEQGVCISVHRVDQTATVQTLLQQLCDGKGKANKGCYPTFARGVAPSEQRLYMDNGEHLYRKRLLPHRTFAHYDICNGGEMRLVWQRVTPAELAAEATTIELRIRPLLSDKLPAILLDAALDDALWWVKAKLCAMLPNHHRWDALSSSLCYLYFPATSDTELSDDNSTLLAMGVGSQSSDAQFGVRWEGDRAALAKTASKDNATAEERQIDANKDEVDEKGQRDSAPMDVDQQPDRAVQDEADRQPASEEDGKEEQVELRIFMGDYYGPELHMTVQPSTTVLEVKERLMKGQVGDDSSAGREVALGVPVDEQQLTHLGFMKQKVLNNSRTLAFYGLDSREAREMMYQTVVQADSSTSSGDTARTIELSLLHLYGGTPLDSKYEQREAMDCPANQTVGELRRDIRGRMSAGHHIDEVRVRRDVSEPELSDAQTLTEVGFKDGGTVVVDFYPTTVHVTLVTPSPAAMSTFTLFADRHTTVRELKERIAAHVDGYPVEWQWAELIKDASRSDSWTGGKKYCRATASLDDELPLSHYGMGSNQDEHAHMLVCRRPHPQPTQRSEQDVAQQMDKLLHLLVGVTANNDLHLVDVMAWQPLLVVMWQLAWKEVEHFDAQRLSLCPPVTVPSTVQWRSASSELRPLTDEFASLQSLGITDGRVLQLDRSDVSLVVWLPQDTEQCQRPLQETVHGTCVLHAQLDDTVQQLKDKLHSLTNVPADRMFFRFHRLLPVDVDDRLTLRELGFTARGKTEKYVEHSWSDGYIKENELMVRLLPHPAPQPASAEQQHANQLVQVGVRVLAHSSRVYRMWLQSHEHTSDVWMNLWRLLESVVRPVDPARYWSVASTALTVGERTADGQAVSELLMGGSDELPIIDVLVRPSKREAPMVGGETDDDVAEAVVEVNDAAESGRDGEADEKNEVGGREVDVERHQSGGAPSGDVHVMGNEATHSDKGSAQSERTDGVAGHTAEPAPSTADKDGLRFCLHPQHLLRLVRPYVSSDGEVVREWYCHVCSREEDLTPDRKCWHCDQCKYDVCQLCVKRAEQPLIDTPEEGDDINGTVADGEKPTAEDEGDDVDSVAMSGSSGAGVKEYHTSTKYAWLPTDFHVNEDGTVRCWSYINNLHPIQHAAMYPLIEQVVGRFIPLFERVLTSLRHPPRDKVPVGRWYKSADWERLEKEAAVEQRRLGAQFNKHKTHNQWARSRPVHQPDVPPFDAPPAPPSTVSLRGRRLQLIVKLADIVLTPQQPKYAGGVWHVEGMRNECIVASGIAYYDQSNIGPSSLAFRCAVAGPMYEQNDERGVEVMYGLRNDEALVQPLGAVDTCEGRCIAFPNIFQHRVEPFSLLDPTKPGHRSILALFLVDPAIPVTSTSRVPPQQREWIAGSEYASAVTDVLGGTRVLSELVDSYIDWPMSRNEAEQHREKLMYERKYFVKENTATVFERPFNLCEH